MAAPAMDARAIAVIVTGGYMAIGALVLLTRFA
jgi:hypothetical protein